MENINKLTTLNIYPLLKKYISSTKSSPNENKPSLDINPNIIKTISELFTSLSNESFAIIKFEESPTKIHYFKLFINTSISSFCNNNFELIDTPEDIEDKNIITMSYNKFNMFFSISLGNTYAVISQNNLDFESLFLNEAMKLTGILSKKCITKISCGEMHALFLTKTGMVFTIGDNSCGQLGIGENSKVQQSGEGILIQELLNFKITDIFAGNEHSMCFGSLREISKNGNLSNKVNISAYYPSSNDRVLQYLFVWGDNSYGQLGIKLIKNDSGTNMNDNIILKPTKLSLNENPHSYAITNDTLVSLTGGLYFSVVLLSSGKLYTFGDKQFNQILAIKNSERPCLMSRHIPKEYGRIIKAITSAYSLLLITSTKKLLIFGKFNNPQLDHVSIVDLLLYDEKMKFIFTDTKLKYVTFEENVTSQKIFEKVTKEKIEDLIDKALEESQEEKKYITRKTLGSNTTLKDRDDMSFCVEKSMDFGLDINREDFNKAMILMKGNKNNNDIRANFNDFIKEINTTINMDTIEIETHEKKYLDEYNKKIKEYLINSQNDINKFNQDNRIKNRNKKKENKNNIINKNSNGGNKGTEGIKHKSDIRSHLFNNNISNKNDNQNQETKIALPCNLSKKEKEKEIKIINNNNLISNDIENNNYEKNKEINQKFQNFPKLNNNLIKNQKKEIRKIKIDNNNNKRQSKEFQLSEILANEEEDDNSLENYSTNNIEKENKTKNNSNIKNIKFHTIVGNRNDLDDESNNSFSIFRNLDSSRDSSRQKATKSNNKEINKSNGGNIENNDISKKIQYQPQECNNIQINNGVKIPFNTIESSSVNKKNNKILHSNNKNNPSNNSKNMNNLYNSQTINNKPVKKKYNFINTNGNKNQQTIIEEIRELGQFLSKEITKYSKQRTDAKKELFFSQIISSMYNPSITNLNLSILTKNIISGVPNHFRGRFWLKFIGNKFRVTPENFKINLQIFEQNIVLNNGINNANYILPFPYLGIFKEGNPLAKDLHEVLNAFCAAYKNVPYTENLSYILGVLLINMDRYQAYQCLINLISNKNRIIFYEKKDKNEKENNIIEENNQTPKGNDEQNIAQINLRRVIFKQLIFFNLPDLCSQLELLNILPENYFDEWCATMFSKNFNIDLVMRIWDIYVVLGEKVIFYAGVLLLKELEEDLMNCEEKEEALEILLNSQQREINEKNIMENILNVKYPEWIKDELKIINQEDYLNSKFK